MKTGCGDFFVNSISVPSTFYYDHRTEPQEQFGSSQFSPTKEMPKIMDTGPKRINHTVLSHTALLKEIYVKYRQLRKIIKLVGGKIIRKYRLQQILQQRFGWSRKFQNSILKVSQRSDTKVAFEKLKIKIIDFLERDDNSRILTGKKETITRAKD